MSSSCETVVIDRREGPHGEVVLRRQGELLQIIANGCFLMDTSDGRSERFLVRAALAELGRRGLGRREETRREETRREGTRLEERRSEERRGAHPRVGLAAPRLLIGGLGVGFSLAEAAREPHWGRIDVIEREQAIIDWHREDGPLSAFSAEALADERTRIVPGDLLDYLAGDGVSYDALCLDIDNGPDWTVTDGNGSLYSPAGLDACRARLTPGGVLAVWSAQPSPAFEETMRNNGFTRVRTEEIPVVRGVPDVVHFATKPA